MRASEAGALLRATRLRHQVDQRTLARLAGTSQTQVSRIERALVSPSVTTLVRLFAALGERLELVTVAEPAPGQPGWFPDHDAERAEEYRRTTSAERVVEAMRLSAAATAVAGGVSS